MISKPKSLYLIIGLATCLAACSRVAGPDNPFRDRSKDYLLASDLAPLEIPEGLDSLTLGHAYPIPPSADVVTYETIDNFEIPRPKAAALNRSAGDVRIQFLGDERWILVSAPPSEAWPRVRSFMTRNSIPSLEADASNGTIESDWFSFRDAPEVVHQFKFVLEQGLRVNTTEIKVLQRSYNADSAPSISPPWQEESTDLDREEWMRSRLAETLAAEELSGSASLMGLDIGAAPKVQMITPRDEDPYILMNLDATRAYAGLRYALETESFEREGQSSQDNLMRFKYFTEREHDERNLLMRTVLGEHERAYLPLQIEVDEAEDGLRVYLESRTDETLDRRTQFEILTHIRNNLG